jgi:hypothetical protein
MTSNKPLGLRRLPSALYCLPVLAVLLLTTVHNPQTSIAHSSKRDTVTLTINNCSKWTIKQLYMMPVGESGWGNDRLGSGTLRKVTGTIPLYLDPDEYDIKLVDEAGYVCKDKLTVPDRGRTWCIKSEWLRQCEKRTCGCSHS